MSMNDPLGDLLARIRNAQMPTRAVSRARTRAARKRARGAQERRLYPRLYGGRARGPRQIDIELKYFDGEP